MINRKLNTAVIFFCCVTKQAEECFTAIAGDAKQCHVTHIM